MSIINPLVCGFAKIATFNIFKCDHKLKKAPNENDKVFKSRVLNSQYQQFINYFESYKENYAVDLKHFKSNFPRIVEVFKKLNKRNSETKEILQETFSKEAWDALSDKKKLTHRLDNCRGCLDDNNLKQSLGKFPIRNKKQNTLAIEAGLFREKILCDVTNRTVDELDRTYKEVFKTTFTKQVLTHVKTFQPKEAKDIKSIGKDIVKRVSKSIRRNVSFKVGH